MKSPVNTIPCRSSLPPGTRYRTPICRAFFLLTAVVLLSFGSLRSAVGQDSATNTDNKLSTQFTKAATSAMISIHQAKQHIATVVSQNLPSGAYNPDYATRAYEQVRNAQLEATTAGDQQTEALLNSYFLKVKEWAEKYKAARQSMNATRTMGEDFLTRDSDWQAIESCEKAFNTLLINRVYDDIRACR